ncbi:MAG: hypothetical protein JWN52_7330 [Actinomycetia bacterium]|nr:hypothetical protein [Actinomycetes bacterium]
MTSDRHLDWEGCHNVRDLGGLRSADGRETRRGAIVRADSLDRLTPRGWSALVDYGVRTIVDLRNDYERPATAEHRPDQVTTVHVPLDDTADHRFWDYIQDNELDGTPLYYLPFLEHKPERCAAAITAIARARPGGVVIHCSVGRDRTGLITLLLLSLVGVSPEEIVADYELSATRLSPLFAEYGMDDQGPYIEGVFKRKNTSARTAILATLKAIDTASYLCAANLSDDELDTIRTRLLGTA